MIGWVFTFWFVILGFIALRGWPHLRCPDYPMVECPPYDHMGFPNYCPIPFPGECPEVAEWLLWVESGFWCFLNNVLEKFVDVYIGPDPF